MFEPKDRNTLHQDMLSNIAKDYDKTEGSFIYDVTKSTGIELEKVYQDMGEVVQKIGIDNLSGDELAQRINERTGITRKPATKAVGTLNVIGNGTITEGALFETGTGIKFTAIETKGVNGNGTIAVACTESGIAGNVPANQITFMPVTIAGIDAVYNMEPTSGGFEAEADEELLERYYERIRVPATSGNKAQYKSWAKEVPGVGDARVISLWNGDNTVKVIIINADMQPIDTGTSPNLVEEVQQYLDPLDEQGNPGGAGEGIAPIGALVTVASVTGKQINIAFTAVKDAAYTDEEIRQNVENSIVQYLKEIAFAESHVSYAKIGSLILNSEGIQDYSNLLVNGGTSNVSVGEEEVAVLGVVTLA